MLAKIDKGALEQWHREIREIDKEIKKVKKLLLRLCDSFWEKSSRRRYVRNHGEGCVSALAAGREDARRVVREETE